VDTPPNFHPLLPKSITLRSRMGRLVNSPMGTERIYEKTESGNVSRCTFGVGVGNLRHRCGGRGENLLSSETHYRQWRNDDESLGMHRVSNVRCAKYVYLRTRTCTGGHNSHETRRTVVPICTDNAQCVRCSGTATHVHCHRTTSKTLCGTRAVP